MGAPGEDSESGLVPVSGPGQDSEAILVHRARHGDVPAFGRLVRMYGVRAYRVAFSLTGDRHETEDVIQEALENAFANLGQLRDETAYWPWLARVVGNRCRDLLRRRGARRRAPLRLECYLTTPPTEDPGEHAALWAAVRALKAPHRTVALLHYSGELSTPEMAAALGRPVRTVRRWLAEAYRSLCRLMEGVG